MSDISVEFILFSLVVICFTSSCTTNSSSEHSQLSSVDSLSQLIVNNPQSSALYMARSRAYRELEGYDEAIADIQRAIFMDTTKASYFYELSDTYFDYLNPLQARIMMEQAVLRFPDSLDAHLKLARVLIIIKDYDDASRALQQAKALDPLSAEVEYARGIFFLDQGRADAAKNAFKAAVELDDDFIDAWLALGQISSDLGEPVAEMYYANALQVDPHNISALHSNAFYFHNRDSLDRAASLYQKINQIDSTYIHAYFNQGIIYLEQNLWDSARQMFEKSFVLDSTMALAPYYLGITNESMENTSEAIENYSMAIALDSTFERAKEALSALQTENQ